jgi:hypothetical protein
VNVLTGPLLVTGSCLPLVVIKMAPILGSLVIVYIKYESSESTSVDLKSDDEIFVVVPAR